MAMLCLGLLRVVQRGRLLSACVHRHLLLPFWLLRCFLDSLGNVFPVWLGFLRAVVVVVLFGVFFCPFPYFYIRAQAVT